MKNSAFKNSRKLVYLNSAGADKPLKNPVPEAVLDRARHYRLKRLRDQLITADCRVLISTYPAYIQSLRLSIARTTRRALLS